MDRPTPLFDDPDAVRPVAIVARQDAASTPVVNTGATRRQRDIGGGTGPPGRGAAVESDTLPSGSTTKC